MAGRVFKIVVTKSLPRYECVIMQVFNVSGSRDDRYGMPTMHTNPDCGYQMISPSVSCGFLQPGLMLMAVVRTSHSSSTLSMIAKVGNVATQSTTPALKTVELRRRSRERSLIPPTTNSSSTLMHFTTRGAFVRCFPGTSLSLCRTSPIARSSTTRWQENYRRPTPESVQGQRRRRGTRVNKRRERLSWQREPTASKAKTRCP